MARGSTDVAPPLTPIFRFAPSPTGYLHLGHALSALSVWRAAEAVGGKVLLRIEDTDLTRCRPEFTEAILEDLAWLGLSPDGPVRRQSEHFEDYARALGALKEKGLVYPCRLSRSDITLAAARAESAGRAAPRDPDGATRLPIEGAVASDPTGPLAWRLDLGRAIEAAGPLDWFEEGSGPDGETGRISARPEDWGDVVVARKDTPTSYHLAVSIDDTLQGVTHVVRGQDVFFATAIHRLLQMLLGLPAPIYRHHKLLLGPDGRKLSKSDDARSLRSLRVAGWAREDVISAVEPLLR